MSTKETKFTQRTGKLKDVKLVNPWPFPELSPGGTGKILTKHFTNLALTLHRDPLALISFLVYQSHVDNSVTFSTKLLKQFEQAVILATRIYDQKKIGKSLPTSRRSFKILIERGLLLRVSEKEYLINPHLCYSKLYVNATFYKAWKGDVLEWINHVRRNVEKRT